MKKIIKNNIAMLKLIQQASKFRILLAILKAVLDSIHPVLGIIIVKIGVDMVTSNGSVTNLIQFLLVILLIYTIIMVYSSWYNQKYCAHSDLYIRQYIQSKVYSKIQNIDMEAFDDSDFYSSYTKAVNETSKRATTVLNTVSSLLSSILSFIGVVSIIIWLNPIVILFVLGSVALSIIVSEIQNKASYQHDMEQTDNNRKADYVGRVFYLQQFAKEIKIFSLYDYFIEKFSKALSESHKTRRKYENKFFLLGIFENAIQIVTVLATIAYLGIKTLAGAITIGDFSGLLNASQELGNTIQQIFAFIPNIAQNSLYIDNINTFLNYKSVIERKNTGKLLQPGNHAIIMNGISFKYTDDGPYILNNVSFTINPGDIVAIVGYNGSGKTTLIKNLLRLYDPNSGSITLDGHDYKEYDVYSLRSRIGVVFQDFQCYATTIADNILLRPAVNAEDEKLVWKALEMSGLAEKVKTFENNIYTILTKEFDNNGVVLSGGELQKLALARIFAQDYDILILDEPSSALDPLAEYELNNRIMKIAQNKTLIIISHRLSTTCDADRIIFMELGKIEETGSHKELMALNGKYAQLYNLQVEKYLNSKDVFVN